MIRHNPDNCIGGEDCKYCASPEGLLNLVILFERALIQTIASRNALTFPRHDTLNYDIAIDKAKESLREEQVKKDQRRSELASMINSMRENIIEMEREYKELEPT